MSIRTFRPLLSLPRTSLQRAAPTFADAVPAVQNTTQTTASTPRTFLTAATTPTPQTLTASRTLPYPARAVYSIIADIDAYPSFVPLCRAARITSWSRPDTHHKQRWPQRATLTIGYGNAITESFTSRVFCVPPVDGEMGRAGVGYVEALSGTGVRGEVRRRLKSGDAADEGLAHHDVDVEGASADGGVETDVENGPLEMLKTRWTVRGYPFKPAPENGSPPQEGSAETASNVQQRTDVTLSIEFKFASLAYDIMSRAVAPTLAEKMIDAFERRVKSLLDK